PPEIHTSAEEVRAMRKNPPHFQTWVSAMVLVYNLPRAVFLTFKGEVPPAIFSGPIRTWNDRAIAELNPKATLPAKPIVVVHRSDASGTTYAFTNYLSQVSETWKNEIGLGPTVHWPTGEAAVGNAGLAELVKKTENSISYLELNYAIQEKLTYGFVRNAAGNAEKPDFKAMGAAMNAIEGVKADFRSSIVNSPAAGAYPICTLTWL